LNQKRKPIFERFLRQKKSSVKYMKFTCQLIPLNKFEYNLKGNLTGNRNDCFVWKKLQQNESQSKMSTNRQTLF